jgi:hypothetical protein
MLLYNIGRLNRKLPPHFMMLSSVSQSRTFSAGTSFQWMSNPSIWTAGPFTAGGAENPTITFVPIQGQDFAQRFESPLTDKFTLFIEDREWYATAAEEAEIVMLFAQSLNLLHGDEKQCSSGWYVNKNIEDQDKAEAKRKQQSKEALTSYDEAALAGRDSSALFECVTEIAKTYSDYELVDGSHPVPTEASADPLAADLVTALGAGYKWAKIDDKFALTNPVKIPAWFDYVPEFTAPSGSKPKPNEAPSPVWSQSNAPDGKELVYGSPKGYKWKAYKVNKNDKEDASRVYALVPDGYDLERDRNGKLKRDKDKNLVPVEVKAKEPSEYVRISYRDEIAGYVWPVPQNYFYVELRNNDPKAPVVTDAVAKRACFPQPDKDDPNNNVVCGFLKIGNLLQIMQRLAEQSCTPDAKSGGVCGPSSIFGIGPKARIPQWADSKAPFTYRAEDGSEEKKWVWVPAHDPQKDPGHAERDRLAFFNLYKLYQMSLVDTTKLVTGAPPITISK